MAKITIDLIIPGLFHLPAHELDADALAAATPQLHKLLRHARRVAVSVVDFDTLLLRRLGMAQPAVPWAQAIEPTASGARLLFRPVHLKADINNAIVFPVAQNGEEIVNLINDLRDFFKQDCDIRPLPDGLWTMQLHQVEAVQGVPHYLSVLGKKVSHYLEQAKTNLDWFRLFNEMQMFLYQHSVNARRMQQGQLTINSLWCWGADHYGGEQLENTDWYSDDIALDALGTLVGANVQNLTALQRSTLQRDTIIIDLSLLEALKHNPQADLQALLMTLEQKLISPLMAQKNMTIRCCATATTDLHYRPAMRWQWWKKPCQLAELMSEADA